MPVEAAATAGDDGGTIAVEAEKKTRHYLEYPTPRRDHSVTRQRREGDKQSGRQKRGSDEEYEPNGTRRLCGTYGGDAEGLSVVKGIKGNRYSLELRAAGEDGITLRRAGRELLRSWRQVVSGESLEGNRKRLKWKAGSGGIDGQTPLSSYHSTHRTHTVTFNLENAHHTATFNLENAPMPPVHTEKQAGAAKEDSAKEDSAVDATKPRTRSNTKATTTPAAKKAVKKTSKRAKGASRSVPVDDGTEEAPGAPRGRSRQRATATAIGDRPAPRPRPRARRREGEADTTDTQPDAALLDSALIRCTRVQP
ncbi:hypothetical protein C8F04DRAFT_1200233 [Mycena alexandri]|uniref:Uncharacterized protein n=1 Tax=Mycena alexandri TaxID=1745969 RepID=A0AAD6RYE6_9AGAR|nr:hypothetical protein C8F04DRAFT_1200233 [Mycena alexandri]